MHVGDGLLDALLDGCQTVVVRIISLRCECTVVAVASRYSSSRADAAAVRFGEMDLENWPW